MSSSSTAEESRGRGPLHGIRLIELAGIGPAPFAAMLLADLGATVLRIDRPVPAQLGIERPLKFNLLLRNRQNLAIDLKSEAGRALVLELVERADGLIEGFRPGVTERLGLGPDPCLARNPRLVYGRMTGWGQDGPLAQAAGHDLNYIALTGVLSWIGRPEQGPVPPLNLVGDFGGGGLYLALGMLAAILESRIRGHGQVVDAAIIDGTASLATSVFGMHAAGLLGSRGSNILDGGPRSMTCTAARMASTSVLRPSNRSSTRSSAVCWDIPSRPSDASRTGKHGVRRRSNSDGSSRPTRGTSGASCWRGPMPAFLRCWSPRRPLRIRT